MKIGVFIPMRGFAKDIRHSRRSGNPEPVSCAMAVVLTGDCRVRVPSFGRVGAAMTVLAHSQSSGFPLRRQ